MHGMTHEPVKSVSSSIDKATGAVVDTKAKNPDQQPRLFFPKLPSAAKPDIVERVNRQFPKVYMTLEEVKELRFPLAKGLQLLGFKPRSELEEWHNTRPSTFIYPGKT